MAAAAVPDDTFELPAPLRPPFDGRPQIYRIYNGRHRTSRGFLVEYGGLDHGDNYYDFSKLPFGSFRIYIDPSDPNYGKGEYVGPPLPEDIAARNAEAAAIARRRIAWEMNNVARRRRAEDAARNAAASAATQAALEAERKENAARNMKAAAAVEKTAAIIAANGKVCPFRDCGKPAPFMCGRCLSIYYCGRQHQKADWQRHKFECVLLNANAKAGGRRRTYRRSKRSNRKSHRFHKIK